MLWRVSHKPHNLQGLVAALFTGEGSVSVIVDDEWGHFERKSLASGRFVIDPASKILDSRDVTLTCVGLATAADRALLKRLAGVRWRFLHNCFFSALRPFWRKCDAR